MTREQLEEIANANGVQRLYMTLVDGIQSAFDGITTTLSNRAFIGVMGEKKARNTIFCFYPKDSSEQKGLRFTVYTDRFAEYFGIAKSRVVEFLPGYERQTGYGDWAGEHGEGYFRSDSDIERFFDILSERNEA